MVRSADFLNDSVLPQNRDDQRPVEEVGMAGFASHKQRRAVDPADRQLLPVAKGPEKDAVAQPPRLLEISQLPIDEFGFNND